MAESLVSIVLTTFNSEKTINDVLNSIIQQDYPLDKIELVIVDGGSRDKTLLLIEDFLRNNKNLFHDTKLLVHDKNYGLSRARNDGIRSSRGKYILIMDDDIVLNRSTVRELVEFLEGQPLYVGGVMPLHINIPESKLEEFFRKIKENRVSDANAIASCVLLRREMIERIGLYDETLGLPYTMGEEIEYWARALRHGFRILLAGHIKVLHAIDAEYWKTTRRNYNVYIDKSSVDPGKAALYKRVLRNIRSLFKRSYIYAYRRYFSSAPISIKAKWILYLLSNLTTIAVVSLFTLSLLFKHLSSLLASTLLIYAFILLISYLTVVKEYWNGRVFHISLVYSAIAYAWRVVRSIALLIPVNKCPHRIPQI